MATHGQLDNQDVFEFLLGIGDNCLILGHRLSEWCGHAPAPEEDIALANTALDLIGHARLWLELAGRTEQKGRSADALAYLRDAPEFRNVALIERPNGDYGKTLMRQFLFDSWHLPFLTALKESKNAEIAGIAGKALKEVAYHLERSRDLVVRLGDGTDESNARMQAALDDLWPYTGELFAASDGDLRLTAAGIAPDVASVKKNWCQSVGRTLVEAKLVAPAGAYMHQGAKRGIHTEHMGFILAEMQVLQRSHPGARW